MVLLQEVHKLCKNTSYFHIMRIDERLMQVVVKDPPAALRTYITCNSNNKNLDRISSK